MTDDISINLATEEELNMQVDDYKVNIPVSDEEGAEVITGRGTTFSGAFEDAREQVATRRVELGLVEESESHD